MGKTKWIEKHSGQTTGLTGFFTVQKNQVSINNHSISKDICTLFLVYLYSTLCSWVINNGKQVESYLVRNHLSD